MGDTNNIHYASIPVLDGSSVSKESVTPYSDAVKCRKEVKHVKRPLNPFMIWSQLERRKILEQNPNIQNSNISIQLGKRWKELPDAERIPFALEAERLRVLHSQEFPDYKFSPKKREKKIKRSDSNVKRTKNKPIGSETDNLSKNADTASSKSLVGEGNEKPSSSPNEQLVEEVVPKERKRRKRSEKMTAGEKQIWDGLRKVNVISLAIDKTDSNTSDDSSQQLKQSGSRKQLPSRLYIDNCLTSGSIAALSCYKDDYAAVFDYLTDKVLQSSKNIYKEIETISKEYDEALKDSAAEFSNEPQDMNIPDINKVLGKKWKDPNFGLKFSS